MHGTTNIKKNLPVWVSNTICLLRTVQQRELSQNRSEIINTFKRNTRIGEQINKDRQCAYNLSLWHFPLAIAAVEKKISITYSACVSVALIIHHAMRMRHIVFCCLPGSTIFFHIISQTARFSKKCYWTQNVRFDFLCNVCLKHFSFQEEMSDIWSQMYIGLQG